MTWKKKAGFWLTSGRYTIETMATVVGSKKSRGMFPNLIIEKRSTLMTGTGRTFKVLGTFKTPDAAKRAAEVHNG